MADYDNTNSGVLFQNDKKSEKAPDWTGTYDHEGEVIKLAGWKRTSSKTGKEFISIKRDTYEPNQEKAEVTDTRSGYEKAKAVAQGLKDTTDYDKQVSLSDIPFN